MLSNINFNAINLAFLDAVSLAKCFCSLYIKRFYNIHAFKSFLLQMFQLNDSWMVKSNDGGLQAYLLSADCTKKLTEGNRQACIKSFTTNKEFYYSVLVNVPLRVYYGNYCTRPLPSCNNSRSIRGLTGLLEKLIQF